MNQTVLPGARSGNVTAPSSKSMAHRYLICAALSGQGTSITCPGISKDIEATIRCLGSLGADIRVTGGEIRVNPSNLTAKNEAVLSCSESGSTLRFLLPVAGMLGTKAVFEMEGRLPERPMREYEDLLCAHGMHITRDKNLLKCSGKLIAGDYSLPGNISSQYFTGLLFALPFLDGNSRIIIEGNLESADYLEMTKAVLKYAHLKWEEDAGVLTVPGNQTIQIPDHITVEGDYSSAAFFLCAGALSGEGICVGNLSNASGQGDKRITEILKRFGAVVETEGNCIRVRKGTLKGISLDASMIPDLVPVISVVASAAAGTTRISNASRLRLKESDRLKSTADMLSRLGADIQETQDGLVIHGKNRLQGGVKIDPYNDHRIAMAAAVAAAACSDCVEIMHAECVEKSYPDFWKDLETLKVSPSRDI